MGKEIKTLEQNASRTLEDLQPGKKAIDSKWVYKMKYKPDGKYRKEQNMLGCKRFYAN